MREGPGCGLKPSFPEDAAGTQPFSRRKVFLELTMHDEMGTHVNATHLIVTSAHQEAEHTQSCVPITESRLNCVMTLRDEKGCVPSDHANACHPEEPLTPFVL